LATLLGRYAAVWFGEETALQKTTRRGSTTA